MTQYTLQTVTSAPARPSTRRIRRACSLALVTLLVAGCGQDSSETADPPPEQAAEIEDAEPSVDAADVGDDEPDLGVSESSPNSAVGDAVDLTRDSGSAAAHIVLELIEDSQRVSQAEVSERTIFGGESASDLRIEEWYHLSAVAADEGVYLITPETEARLFETWILMGQDDAAERMSSSLGNAAFGGEAFVPFARPGSIERLMDELSRSSQVDLLGRDLEGSQPVTKYLVTTDGGGFFEFPMAVEVRIDDSGRLQGFEILISFTPETTLTVAMTLSDFGEIDGGMVPEGSSIALADFEEQLSDQASSVERTMAEQDAMGLTQDVIEELTSLTSYFKAGFWDVNRNEFIRHPDTGELCLATQWHEPAATEQGFRQGDWTTECGPLPDEADRQAYCAAHERTTAAYSGQHRHNMDVDEIQAGLRDLWRAWHGEQDPYREDQPFMAYGFGLDYYADYLSDYFQDETDSSLFKLLEFSTNECE